MPRVDIFSLEFQNLAMRRNWSRAGKFPSSHLRPTAPALLYIPPPQNPDKGSVGELGCGLESVRYLEVCLVLRPKDLVKGVTRPRKCLSLNGNKLLEFQTETCSTDFLGTLTS